MRIKTFTSLLFVATLVVGCDTAPKSFEMTVEKVDELKGFILKGISVSGLVTSGCIANNDIYKVKRNGEIVLETDTRILEVSNIKPEEFEGKAAKGDTVHLYIPDGKPGDVEPGDILLSDNTSCDKARSESDTTKE